jgi:dihydroorotate dehydrogenase electron transfer subunit
MPFDRPARVLHHQQINPDHFLMTLECPPIARRARPGQFVMLQVRDGSQPLLRRPMSLHRIPSARAGRIEVLYKVVGEGTRYLARQPVGARLAMLGPLGNGFRLPRSARDRERRAVLVSGGIGIAIFPMLVDALLRLGIRPRLLYGARSRRDLVSLPYFRSRRVPVALATEDGSAGKRGFVTRLLEPLLEAPRGGPAVDLYVCGPTPMMGAVAAIAMQARTPCQLALEAHMPCGIGVCLGCVVPRDGGDRQYGFQRVCTEGPVFDAAQVRL